MKTIGIYYIENKINGKIYIGGSANVKNRFKQHQGKLRSGKHRNSALMADYEKYGKSVFTYQLVEECSKENLKDIEQKHVDSKDFESLYNLQKDVYGGGADVLKQPVYLLSLRGNVVGEFESGAELAKRLKRKILAYGRINTETVTHADNKKYRIVTPEFYAENLDLIKSWSRYSNIGALKRRLKSIKNASKVACTLIDKNGNEMACKTQADAGKILGISGERVRQLISKGFKAYKGFTFKKNQDSIKTLPNTSSNYKGISWNKKAKKWVAFAQIDGKREYLGYFNEEEEAYLVQQNTITQHFAKDVKVVDFEIVKPLEWKQVTGLNQLKEVA